MFVYQLLERVLVGQPDNLLHDLAAFANPGLWRTMQLNAMKRDFSWDVSAREYVKVYESAAGTARGKG